MTISGSTANSNLDIGFLVFADGINVDGATANDNGTWGFDLVPLGDLIFSNSTANGNGDDGLDTFAAGNVTISGFTDNGNGDDGSNIDAGGNVTISGTTANDNEEEGIQVSAGGDATVSGTTANRNGNNDSGIDVSAEGKITVSGSSANENSDNGFELAALGDVSVSNSTANGNADDGFDVRSSSDVALDGLTAIDNDDDGIDIEEAEGNVQTATVQNSWLQGNGIEDDGQGLDFDDSDIDAAGPATGNIICDNNIAGLELDADVTVNATGNWWGSASGPFHPVNNPGGTGDAVTDKDTGDSGTVDFDPWVDTVSGSAAAATEGQPSAVSFQFSGGAGTVFLGQGPGDPNGSAPFALTTDNGIVTPSAGFINKADGTLEVTLTPASEGTAIVTVTGPCGLQGSQTVVVAAVAEDVQQPTTTPTPTPTPTVASAVQLPASGGTPPDAGSSVLPWLAAIVGAFALVSGGGIFVAVRRRR